MRLIDSAVLLARRFLRPPQAPVARVSPPPPPAAPPRLVAGFVQFQGLFWHPVLGVQDETRLVVSAKAGLPHCARCDKALALEKGPREVWSCPACGDARPGTDVDFFALDSVIAAYLKDFLQAHPDFRPAPGLSAPARALTAAATS